jgi:succinate-semialdehyde dehydrogenase / glutarate-semialdehyde dehydrogenase
VFADADLDQAMEAIFALKWRHAGQACITANRIYVQKPIYDKFAEMMLTRVKTLKIGHGSEADTTLGPVTTSRSLDKAELHVKDAQEKGGRILSGGKRVADSGGYFFHPTIIADAHDDMLLAQEEQFAPIAALFPFDNEAEVVEKANNTSVSYHVCFDASLTYYRWDLQVTSSPKMLIVHGDSWRISRLA